MTANKLSATQDQDHANFITSLPALRSPGWLAKWPLIGLCMFIFGSLMFAGLAYNLTAQGPLLGLDRLLAATLPAAALKSPPFVKMIMDAGFYIGKEVVIVLGALIGLYLLIKRSWQELLMLTIGLVGASLLFGSLTTYFDRMRPPSQIWILVNLPGFPSGHAITTFTFYALLAYFLVHKMPSALWKGLVVAAALFIIGFVGFSRVFTAGHYLTDVLAGYAVGIAWAGAVFTLIEIVFQKGKRRNVKEE